MSEKEVGGAKMRGDVCNNGKRTS